MQTYLALARKWRPKTFEQVIGQTQIVQTLKHSLTTQRLHHAYLFTGTRGVGKTTLARLFAKCLSCQKGPTAEPCGQCQACIDIDQGCYWDLVEVDAASRTKVEDTRELMDNTQFVPHQGRYKIYIIDEVHMLSNHSFNALLKTLEEPPAHVKFFFATTEPNKIPVTILSRCLQLHLRTVSSQLLAEHLTYILTAENIEFEPEALPSMAYAANGSVRDALSLLEQAIAYGHGQLRVKEVQTMLGLINQSILMALLEAVIHSDAPTAFIQVQALHDISTDYDAALVFILHAIHQMSLLKLSPETVDKEQPYYQALGTLSKVCSDEQLQLFYQIGLLARRDMPLAPSAQTGFEMAILRFLAFQPYQPQQTTVKKTPLPAKDLAEPTSPSPIAIHTASPPVAQSLTVNWPDVVEQLPIKGLSALIANYATVQSATHDSWVLLIDPDKYNLLTSKAEEYLQQALAKHYQRPIKLRCKAAPARSPETPAALKKQQLEQEQQQARAIFEQNPQVQRVTKALDGEIIQANFVNTPTALKG